jgi:uncharacterized protein (TIGR03083 family)
MSEIADRYARLADAFATTIAAVPEERWSATSPCDGWTARDVVQHVCDTQALFLGLVDEEPGDGPPVATDPLGAWRAAAAPVRVVLADPVRAATAYDGVFGPTTFESAIDRFANFDLVVHRWTLRAPPVATTRSPRPTRSACSTASARSDRRSTVPECARSPSKSVPTRT